jgi:hypothetical protein
MLELDIHARSRLLQRVRELAACAERHSWKVADMLENLMR